VSGALVRYRIIAWIVGVVLLVLVLVGMPLKYAGGNDTVVALVGPLHGFLFMAYLVLAFDLGRRAKWPLGRMALVMLAGTIPFLSFWAEHVVTKRWAREPAAIS
jgi:integral membrane protein